MGPHSLRSRLSAELLLGLKLRDWRAGLRVQEYVDGVLKTTCLLVKKTYKIIVDRFSAGVSIIREQLSALFGC